VPWILLVAPTGYVGGALIGDALTGRNHVQEVLGSEASRIAVVLLVTLLFSIAVTYFFVSRHRLSELALQAQTAQTLAAETRLKLLESQLEPHMMFNTLANLRALIGTDPPRAQAMLDHLDGYLRATLSASRAPLHPLSAEFDRSTDYLALMQVRMGPRLSVTLDLPAALQDHPVPPLLLQPLVENAIRHGLEPHSQGGHVALRAARVDNTLTLCVQDNGVGLAEAAATVPAGVGGVGLQLVRERLTAQYGGAARLTVAPVASGGTVATVVLPLPTPT
jgi:LytS/YehU family sensor histidine kinase